MALLTPAGPSFAYCSHSFSGTPSNAGASMTSVTSGTSNNAGSTTSFLSALAHDAELIEITLAGGFTSAQVNRLMLDVMVDPAGGTSWATEPLIPNLICGGAPSVSNAAPASRTYFFPVFVKAGTSIGVRFRYSHTAAIAPKVSVKAYGGNRNPASWWCGQKVKDIGTTTASTSGVSHTAGNSGAYSSWTDFGSPTSASAGYVTFAIQPTSNAISTLGYFFEFGVGGTIIGPPYYVCTSTLEQVTYFSANVLGFSTIPAGTQFQVRGTCSATAEALEVAAYIVS